MKFGIKIWSINKDLIKLAKKHFLKKDFDYIELNAIKNSFDKEILSNIKGITIIINYDNNDVNFAKEELYKENILAIKEAQRFADFLDAKYIIIHPGHDGYVSNVNKLINEINDDRICIENMPGKTFDLKFYCVGRTYEELKKIKLNNYCLDLPHAIKAAITLNIEIFDNIKELLKLNPIIFHICDGNLDNEVDEHLNIGEGEYDFERIAGLIGNRDAWISLETPKIDYKSLDNDLINLKKIREYFD